MAEEKKIIRLADVGELEAGLKKDLAEEEAKGKTADILYCESISDELSDLGNLPTIDPKTLRLVVCACNALCEPGMWRGEPVRPQNAVLPDVWIQDGGCAL